MLPRRIAEVAFDCSERLRHTILPCFVFRRGTLSHVNGGRVRGCQPHTMIYQRKAVAMVAAATTLAHLQTTRKGIAIVNTEEPGLVGRWFGNRRCHKITQMVGSFGCRETNADPH